MKDRISTDDARLLATLERAFAAHAGADGVIDHADLGRALGLRDPDLVRRVLRGFDLNADGVIQKDEFLTGVRTLLFGSDRDKLWFAFRVHDRDDDGVLDQQEVLRMIGISLAESDVTARASQPPEHLSRALFTAADQNQDGKISFDELAAVVSKRPALLRKMTRSEAIWIAPNEELLAWIDELVPPSADINGLRRSGGAVGTPQKRAPSSIATSRSFEGLSLAMWISWALVNVAVFVIAMLVGEDGHPAYGIGRALGKCIDFDGALILLPMMRRFLGWVRRSFLGLLVPVDDAVDFHRIVGHTLFALSITHATAFTIAYAAGHSSPLQLLDTARGLTGVILLIVFTTMWIFSLAFVRRSKRFELFYFTHLLYVVWLGVAIAHAPQFLWAAGVPILGFLMEQALRLRRRGRKATVIASEAMRSGVTRLEFDKPKDLAAGAGDYVFLRIPKIAKHEWHPFTISSAPERSTLAFHIRSLGNWTAALREHVERSPNDVELIAYVDGPYHSPTAPIFESRFVVLIGAGIGVTPFASVLESIVLRAKGARPGKLERAHFFWLNRDAYSFEWFAQLLAELEREDTRELLDMHLCMTGARSGVATLGLEIAREVMHAAGRSDVVTGLRTKTHFGQPDWQTMLGLIAAEHKGERVDVFYCGPPALANKLKPICERLDMTFREEKF